LKLEGEGSFDGNRRAFNAGVRDETRDFGKCWSSDGAGSCLPGINNSKDMRDIASRDHAQPLRSNDEVVVG
jgi:hypothetical protein